MWTKPADVVLATPDMSSFGRTAPAAGSGRFVVCHNRIVASKGPALRTGRPPGSDGVQTRERIRRVARGIFAEFGYEKASFESISRAADISRTALYKYYPSKAELYRDVYTSLFETVFGRLLEEALSRAPSLSGRLRYLFESVASLHREDPTYGSFIATSLVDALRHPEFAGLAEAEKDRSSAFFRTVLADAASSGDLPASTDPDDLANVLFSLLWGLGLFSVFVGSVDELDRAVALIIYAIESQATGRR